jgi:hypothetical protein
MEMGTVHQLAPAAAAITLGNAVQAYLATLAGAEQAGTRTVYGRILRRAERQFGTAVPPGLDPAVFAEWFTSQWGGRATAT